jgi:hypothetical protein
MVGRLSLINQCPITYFDRFRMVVIETKSQIMEGNGHEMNAAQHGSTARHFNNGEHSSSFFVRLSYTFF